MSLAESEVIRGILRIPKNKASREPKKKQMHNLACAYRFTCVWLADSQTAHDAMTVNDGVGSINHLSCHEMSCARAVLYQLLLMTVKLRGTAKSEKILNKFGWYLVGCLSL